MTILLNQSIQKKSGSDEPDLKLKNILSTYLFLNEFFGNDAI